MKRAVVAGPNQPQRGHEDYKLELSRVGLSLDNSIIKRAV